MKGRSGWSLWNLSSHIYVVSYINYQGGLVSKRLCMLANDLLVWAQNNLRSLKATHVPGKMNQGPDMSRNNVSSEEWTLHPLAVQRIWKVFDRARVELFTSEDNSHCPIFFTKSTDALAHECPSLPLYAFPQGALLPQVLRRVREQWHKLILIAPLWRNQPWVSELFQLLKAAPWPIPLRLDLLSQANGTIWHPQPELCPIYPLPACVATQREPFVLPEHVLNTMAESRAPSTRRLYSLKWSIFSAWCQDRDLDRSPPMCQWFFHFCRRWWINSVPHPPSKFTREP